MYGNLTPPTFTSSQADLAQAMQYYNPGILGGFGSGFNTSEALANGVNPQAIFEAQYLKSFEPNGVTTFGNILNAGSQLAGLFMGLDNYFTQKDVLKQNLKMAKENHQVAMDEVARIKSLRKNLNKWFSK
jgi:hypothetical protein